MSPPGIVTDRSGRTVGDTRAERARSPVLARCRGGGVAVGGPAPAAGVRTSGSPGATPSKQAETIQGMILLTNI